MEHVVVMHGDNFQVVLESGLICLVLEINGKVDF